MTGGDHKSSFEWLTSFAALLLSSCPPEHIYVRRLFVAFVLLLSTFPGPVHAQQAEKQPSTERQMSDGAPINVLGATLHRLYQKSAAHRAAGKSMVTFSPEPSAFISVVGGEVAIEVICAKNRHAACREVLRDARMDGADLGPLVTGTLPVEHLDTVARHPAVQSIYPALAVPRVGQVTSRGVRAQRSDSLRATLGTDGVGVTVGVMSNTFDNYDNSGVDGVTLEEDIATGDVPPRSRIEVLRDGGEPGSDEGRAMVQIIYDVAPGVDVAYHTALGGRARFAEGIRALAASGATVIVDDLIYLNQPVFQDGIVSAAVDDVVRSRDVVYVTAAGNSGRTGYRSPFRGSQQRGQFGGELHDFDPGPGVDTRQRIRLSEDGTANIALQWAQPYASTGGPGASSDLEIYVLDQNGDLVASAAPERRDNIGGDPFEFTILEDVNVDANGDGQPDTEFDLVIERIEGPRPGQMQYIPFEQQGQFEAMEFATESPTLFGHPNAESAVTVAAVAWFDTPLINPNRDQILLQDFSSVGGLPVEFDNRGRSITPIVRAKPDLAGPDGVNTTFFGQQIDDGDAFPNFFGTSAAAPHVAGLAAIIRAADPGLSAQDIKRALIRSADDILSTRDGDRTETATEDAPGFDFYSGTGLVRGDRISLKTDPVAGLSAEVLASAPDGRIRVEWSEGENAGIATYRLGQSYAGGPVRDVEEVTSRGVRTYETVLEGLEPGIHVIQLSWETEAQRRVEGPSTQVLVSVADEIRILQGPFPNPARTSFQLDIVSSETQNVTFALYDVLGRVVSVSAHRRLVEGRPQRIRINRLEQLASGLHHVRIVGDTFDTAVPVMIVR